MSFCKTISKQTVLERGKFLTVEDHQVELSNGTVIKDWPWLITPDFINVVAITCEGKFVCLRHPKYAIEGTTLAPICGYIEPGENPLTAAKRELLEETGFTSNDWIDLGSFTVDANRGCGKGYFYLAKNASKKSEPTEIDIENPQIEFLSKEQVITFLEKGEVKVISYALNISLALAKL